MKLHMVGKLLINAGLALTDGGDGKRIVFKLTVRAAT